MAAQKKFCLVCEAEMRGRRDKQFCSDYCRAVHNNNLHADKIALIRKINNIIRRNRRILISLNPRGTTIIHKLQLIEAGFAFQYHTNTQTTLSGKTFIFCYDQGYTALSGGKYLLISNGAETPTDYQRLLKEILLKNHQPI
jgi:predicted nucleic acid-binding Zn ribbon protein